MPRPEVPIAERLIMYEQQLSRIAGLDETESPDAREVIREVRETLTMAGRCGAWPRFRAAER